MQFEWDSQKAATNLKKHGVSFELAALAFNDPMQLSIQDRFENGEHRWQTLGMVNGCVLLMVAHTVLDGKTGAEVVRIISARRAVAKERKRYEQGYSF